MTDRESYVNPVAVQTGVRLHKYPMVRSGGLFLMLLGLGMIGSVLFATGGLVNNAVFFAGVAVATGSLFLARRLSYGKPSRTQVMALCGAIFLEVLLMNIVGRTVAHDLRIRWLWALVVVGTHFLPMTLAFGPRMLLLGALCIANAVLGLAFASISLFAVVLVDGTLKTAFGMWMLQTKSQGTASS